MNRSTIAAVGAALVLGSAGAAAAHHSAVQFDFGRSVALTGVVKEFEPINPHMRMILVVNGPKGPHDVELEGHSTNNMYRNGYRKGMINVGDNITVNIAPLRNGVEGGYFISAVTAKGVFFGAKSTRAIDAASAAKAAAEGK